MSAALCLSEFDLVRHLSIVRVLRPLPSRAAVETGRQFRGEPTLWLVPAPRPYRTPDWLRHRVPSDPLAELRKFFGEPTPEPGALCPRSALFDPGDLCEPCFVFRGVGIFGAREPHEPSRMRDVVEKSSTAYERPSRADFAPKAEPRRVRTPLTPSEQVEALEHLNARPIRESLLAFVGTRQDWLHGVWLELVNPPADVERPASLWVRIDRAVGRFEKTQKKQMWAIPLPQTVLTREVSRHAGC